MNAKSLLTTIGLLTAACLPGQVLAQVSVPVGTSSYLNVPYVVGGGTRQQLDVYVPSGASAQNPMVLYIHGGGWASGSKDTVRGVNSPVVAELLNRGFVVASMNYRYSTSNLSASFPPPNHTPFPAQVQDAKSAIRFLRANAATYSLDPNRFGVWGQSAGGHIALMVGLTDSSNGFDVGQNLAFSSRVQAVAAYFPVSDISLYGSSSTTPSDPSYPLTVYLNGMIQNNPATLAASRPGAYASPDDPSVMIVHGTADTTVPLSHSQNLLTSLTTGGVNASLTTLAGRDHFFTGDNEYAVNYFATTIPEPSSVFAVAATAGLLTLRRRRRQG